MEMYLCWHDLDTKSRNWHTNMRKSLETQNAETRRKQIPSHDLYVFDDIHMDDDFSPRQKKSDV